MTKCQKKSSAIAGLSIMLIVAWQPARAQQPLHVNVLPIKQDPPAAFSSEIMLTATSQASSSDSADEAARKFSGRTAAAIRRAAGLDLSSLKTNSDDYGLAILARFAYQDYFNVGADDRKRRTAADSLRLQRPGQTGTGEENYDFLLNLYIPLLYKYFTAPEMEPIREQIVAQLLNVHGPLARRESEHIAGPAGVFVPETENHLFLIETARYLTNQLLYQRTHNVLFDNRRNGVELPQFSQTATAVWLLGALQGILQHDFVEYNAKSYQDQIMKALLNLASYAYDDDVRLGARMALDYVSAKVAVSSNSLRRVPPFRRINNESNTGPVIPNSAFLRSPILRAQAFPDAPQPRLVYAPDPQGPWYAVLAGNTELLVGSGQDGIPRVGNFSLGMIMAGLSDYRIPPPILDLFLNGIHRRFYQRFHHGHIIADAMLPDSTDELYAGSPSYLITAGGRPGLFAYTARALNIGLPLGTRENLGVALPTTFMATDSSLTLDHAVQFGTRSDGLIENGVDSGDPIHTHLCVAPDFACGCSIFIPAEMDPERHPNDPNLRRDGNWTFIDRGSDGTRAGYYLAIFRVDSGANGQCGFLEAYDTWLHPGDFQPISFAFFQQAVKANGAIALKFGTSAINSYTTFSNAKITFSMAPVSEIISVSDQPEPDNFKDKFNHGTVLDSQQGSGVVVLHNPGLASQITLNMGDMFHPARTSESGAVERAGFDILNGAVVRGNEVWVDFDSTAPGAEEGDFYRPVRTLALAQQRVATGGTIKVVPGSKDENIVIDKPMTIRSFRGSAVIGAAR